MCTLIIIRITILVHAMDPTVLVVAVEPEVSAAAAAAVEGLTGMADQRQQSCASPLHPGQEIDH